MYIMCMDVYIIYRLYVYMHGCSGAKSTLKVGGVFQQFS